MSNIFANQDFYNFRIFIEFKVSKSGNLSVVGDTHGQFFDFVRIFDTNNVGGCIPTKDNAFIFNGDMVDRGKYANYQHYFALNED